MEIGGNGNCTLYKIFFIFSCILGFKIEKECLIKIRSLSCIQARMKPQEGHIYSNEGRQRGNPVLTDQVPALRHETQITLCHKVIHGEHRPALDANNRLTDGWIPPGTHLFSRPRELI